MSRRISNPGLADLCAGKGASIADLAHVGGVDQSSIRHYLRGRSSPRLEKTLAKFFRLSVSALREKLGLPALPKNNQENKANDRCQKTRGH